MAWFSAIPIIGQVLDGVFGLLDKAVEDKDKANEIKAAIDQALLSADLSRFQQEIKAQASIVLGEVQGESWLQRNWRPVLMLTIVAIVANNYILAPYLGSIFPDYFHVLALPDRLWDLMTVGVGGYVVGRSGEKAIKAWKGER